MTTKELENYTPKGDLTGFPKEIIARMLECQEEQGNPRDVTVFEIQCDVIRSDKGFDWDKTQEDWYFWYKVIDNRNFNMFFGKYPKQETKVCSKCHKEKYQKSKTSKTEDNSQEFKVGDKVIDILLKEVGVVQDIDYSPNIPYGLSVEFKSGFKSYTINGCYLPEYKNPHLLHYRDDNDYSIIDFTNLPKRQTPKRWRAKVGGKYYSLMTDFKVESFYDCDDIFDNKAYNSGNYFETKEKAQEVADKLNKYFQELINN